MTIANVFKYLILVITLNVQTVPAMEAETEGKITDVEGTQVYVKEAPNSEKIILWLHGGPFHDPLNVAIKTRNHMFTDFNKHGFTIVAPAITDSYDPSETQIREDTKPYKDILNKVARWIKKTYPGREVILISHSKGGHWSGQTMRDTNSDLRNLISQWVFVSGTNDLGASILRQLTLSINGYINLTQPDFATNYNSWKLLQTTGRKPSNGFAHDEEMISPIFDQKIINDLSLLYHVKELPDVPILIISPLKDAAVTIDTSYNFFKGLSNIGKNVNFYVGLNGPHNWMTDNFQKDNNQIYQEYMDVILSFLMHPLSFETKYASKNAEHLVEEYLEQNPSVNYSAKYKQFMNNQGVQMDVSNYDPNTEHNLNNKKTVSVPGLQDLKMQIAQVSQ